MKKQLFVGLILGCLLVGLGTDLAEANWRVYATQLDPVYDGDPEWPDGTLPVDTVDTPRVADDRTELRTARESSRGPFRGIRDFWRRLSRSFGWLRK